MAVTIVTSVFSLADRTLEKDTPGKLDLGLVSAGSNGIDLNHRLFFVHTR